MQRDHRTLQTCRRGIMAIVTAAALASSAQAQEVCDIAKATVFSVNEYVNNKDGLDLALSVPSEVLIRPWFRWRNAANYEKDAWVIAEAHKRGVNFGGGVTISAIYRGENGISEETFLDYATRDPHGKPYPAFGDADYFHGAIANKKYLDYALSWAKKQIDAGADNFFMDEVNGAYGILEGFDDYGLAGFREWLIRRYCEEQRWSVNDPRWAEQFRIPLDDKTVCPDGTIRSFDYRAYLQRFGWADKPDHKDNPLRREWGWPGDMRIGKTYCGHRRETAWQYQCDSLREHARAKGRRIWIAANGLNRHVDFQIQNLWRNVLPKKDGRLDCSMSRLAEFRGHVERSRFLLKKDVPVVIFHDWGKGFPWWDDLTGPERKLWMRLYAPEIYAAGAWFAFPVHGPFGDDCRKDDSLGEIKKMTEYYRRESDLYHGAKWLSARAVKLDREGIACAATCRPDKGRLMVHLINHDVDAARMAPVPIANLKVRLPRLGAVRSVSIASPDLPGRVAGQAAEADGQTTICVPALEAYDVVVIEYDRLDLAPMARDVVIQPVGAWERPATDTFEVGRDGLLSGEDVPNSYLQGRLHPHLRNNPTFVADFARAGAFTVRVNSVATLGARLVVSVDGKKALEADLPDKDGKNDGAAKEYDREFTVPIGPGKHRIAVDNTGGDWMTVDFYVLVGYGE